MTTGVGDDSPSSAPTTRYHVSYPFQVKRASRTSTSTLLRLRLDCVAGGWLHARCAAARRSLRSSRARTFLSNGQGDEMKRARTIFAASTLIALAAVAVGYGSGSAEQRAPSAAPTGSDQAALLAAHQGGTLKLLAKAAAGTIDPHVNYTLQYWQLYQATYDGLLGFKKARRQRGVRGRPGSRDHRAHPDQRRQDVGLHAPQGDQVLERQDGDSGRRGRVVPAHLQGEQPHLRHVLRRNRRREGMHREAGDLHAEGGRELQRERRNRDDQPDGARPRVQVQALRAARRHPAGGRPAERLGHEADPRYRRRTCSRRTTRTGS